MGVFGKIVGGAIGFVLGGPLGAVAGAVFGHVYDESKLLDESARQPASISAADQDQAVFFLATFSMLAKLVRSDGRVSDAEIGAIERFMIRDLGMGPEKRHAVYAIFRQALQSPDTFEDYAAQFYLQFKNKPELIEFMLDILFRVAVADGDMAGAEERLIHTAAQIFRCPSSQFETIRSRYIDDINKHYTTLGCASTDTDETIKRSYRRLARQYHPDRLAANGLPEEFGPMATDTFREIQSAYEAISKERGNKQVGLNRAKNKMRSKNANDP